MKKNKIVLLAILLVNINLIRAHGQECRKLENGMYKVKPKRDDTYKLFIHNDSFVTYVKNERQDSGRIEWDIETYCIFILNYKENQTTEKRDTLRFDLIHNGWGKPCYELAGKNKFRMTWTGNLHITLSEGKIIRTGYNELKIKRNNRLVRQGARWRTID